MKKGVVITLAILATVILIMFFLKPDETPSFSPDQNNTNQTLNETTEETNDTSIFFSPPDLTLPIDCSETNIKTFWDTVFETTLDGINVTTSNIGSILTCSNYYAYNTTQENETYFLAGHYVENVLATELRIIAIKGNFTSADLAILTGIEVTDVNENGDHMTLLENTINSASTSTLLIETPIASLSEAYTEFDSIFLLENVSAFEFDDTLKLYNFSLNVTNNSNYTEINGGIFSEHSFAHYSYIKTTSTTVIQGACEPNWTASNTSCLSDDTYIQHFTDSNDCDDSTGMPNNNTFDCDFDTNGIIGDESSVDTDNVDLTIEIDGSDINLSDDYTGNGSVEIFDNGTSIVTFDYDFTTPLNLKDIEIEKQDSTDTLGYLIVNGIDAEKTFRIDKLDSNSNKVCVEDKSLSSINSISDDCDGNEEVLVDCPGTSGSFSCSVSGGFLIVSGLNHSAVIEYSDGTTNVTPPTTCTADWTCTDWSPSECANGVTRNRICADQNSCNITIGKPVEVQTCSSTTTCTPDWDCSDWTPNECPESEKQTRSCTDSESCGSSSGKPPVSRSCNYDEGMSRSTKVILMIIMILALIGGGVALFLLKKNKSGDKKISPPSTPPRSPPRTPQGTITQQKPRGPPPLPAPQKPNSLAQRPVQPQQRILQRAKNLPPQQQRQTRQMPPRQQRRPIR